MKKINYKPLLFILLVILIMIVGGTYAYYYSEVALPNEFRTMTYNVVLEEEFYDTWGTKKVRITNKEESSVPVVLRINYNEVWQRMDSSETNTLSNTIDGVDVVTKYWSDTFERDFLEGGDGWLYYTKVLNPMESVEILEEIYLNASLIRYTEYAYDYFSNDYSYELTFNYEAIQADEDAIKDIWGYDMTIENGELYGN